MANTKILREKEQEAMNYISKRMKKLEKQYEKTPEKALVARARIEKRMEKLEEKKGRR